MASENQIIAELAAIFGPPGPDVIAGIGDDGAITKSIPENLVLTTDMSVEGVHFKRAWSSFREIGGKIAAANLADVFAMGGKPKYLLVSAGFTSDMNLSDIKELAEGIKAEADLVDCKVIGGDISKASELVISIAVIGSVSKGITRGGAKVGDKVFISNLTGFSAAGLYQLKKGGADSEFVKVFKKPDVRYQLVTTFTEASALIDVSDGLLSECNHIAEASKACLNLEKAKIETIPGFTEIAALAVAENQDVWNWVLTGGEDHAFLGCGSNVPKGAYEIGVVTSGSGVKVDGASEINDLGWRHF